MDRMKFAALVAFVAGSSASCSVLDAGLTTHSRAAASVGASRLSAEDLGAVIAESPMPDSALTDHWAEQLALLWTDYMQLVSAYRSPDTTAALDYTSLLEERRYFAAVAVAQFRDSILYADIEPTDDELRHFFDTDKPFTRMHLRRIVLSVPEDADDEDRDRLFEEAQNLRERLTTGEDFVRLAREHSTEQVGARGQLLQFQGHEDFASAADSVVYKLSAGETSPVVATAEAMLIYHVEEVLSPTFEDVKEMALTLRLEELRDSLAASVVDTLIDNAQIVVRTGSVEAARSISGGDSGRRVSDNAKLAAYRGGEVTAVELRQVFTARPDIRQMFVSGNDDEVERYLHDLARDEVLIRAAYRAGAEPSEPQKERLRGVLAGQLAKIAKTYDLSHQVVIQPGFRAEAEGVGFLRRTLQSGTALPWLGEFKAVVDRDHPGRVDSRGAQAAAAIAVVRRKELREASGANEADAVEEGGE